MNWFIHLLLCVFLGTSAINVHSQIAECPYPILLMHGLTGDYHSFETFYQDTDVTNIFGTVDLNTHIFHVMPNAENTHEYFLGVLVSTNDDINGEDGVWSNNGTDDDVQWIFPNEDNVLTAGCMYAYNFNVGKNDDGTIDTECGNLYTAPCFYSCSDNNEAAIYKQGYAVKRAIEAILLANPTKDKVILVGHSMGGMAGREYLQRQDASGNPQWWIDPAVADGHRVQKFVTMGSPLKGSNFAGNIWSATPEGHEQNRNTTLDPYSEALRDIRWSYEDGTTGPDVPGVYLYGGTEPGIPGFGGDYNSHDVNCDGDEDDPITGVNIDGTLQGYSEVWDGTTFNPAMPLPTNLKYTYYVSDGDGIVDEKRQWLYVGGDGTLSDHASATSVAQPFDGVINRLSDRVNSSQGHLSQNSDINGIARLLDEGDYPLFAHEIQTDTWYFGTVQERADLVPLDSEHTNAGDNLIDGDWYKYTLADTVYQLDVEMYAHTAVAGRLDVYTAPPADYDNANSVYATTWGVGYGVLVQQSSNVDMFLPGDYYIRITHDGNTFANAIEDIWKTPYTFRIMTKDQCLPYLYVDGSQDTAEFKADQQIDSDAILTSGSVVEYQAGDTICLNSGFETQANTEFLAQILNCVNY